MDRVQVLVIGGGPGGYVAAIRAAQLGARVALVEKNKVGGTCLNRGCIPTKSLLASTQILDLLRNSEEFGVTVEEVKPNFSQMMARKKQVVMALRHGIKQLLSANKIRSLKGRATLVDSKKVIVETKAGARMIEAENIIIATGSVPAKPSFLDFSQETVITSDEALKLKTPPKSLLIVGAGVIGLEFACVFSSLRTEITVVEMMDQVLPLEERNIANQMQRLLERRDIVFRLQTKIEGIKEYRPDGITVILGSGEEIEAEMTLVAIGRMPFTSGIGLEELGIEMGPAGNIIVNEKMETCIKGIYAIGDAVGGMMLAHVASEEGIVAAENASGHSAIMEYSAVPACVYTTPEVASVGMTMETAIAAGMKAKLGKFPFAACGKAVITGEDVGFVQIVVEENTERVLGAQILGPHATDLIAEVALAVRWGLKAEQIGSTIHAHPTLAESIMEAAKAASGTAIHVL